MTKLKQIVPKIVHHNNVIRPLSLLKDVDMESHYGLFTYCRIKMIFSFNEDGTTLGDDGDIK